MNTAQGVNPATPLRRLSAWILDGVSFVLAGPAIFFAVAFFASTIDDFLWGLVIGSHPVGIIPPIIVLHAIPIMGWLLVLKLTAAIKWQVIWILAPITLLLPLSIVIYLIAGSFIFVALPVAMASLIAYAIWMLCQFSNGQTVGKRLVGIQAVQQSGRPVSWGLMLVREVVKSLLHLFLIGFIIDGAMLLSDKDEHQSVADRIAGTVVVRVRG